MIRAFRLDDELRDLMLPLLNVPADKFSVTGVNVKAQVEAFEEALYLPLCSPISRLYLGHISLHQVEAFEEAFRRMDADGTNSVSLPLPLNLPLILRHQLREPRGVRAPALPPNPIPSPARTLPPTLIPTLPKP